MSVPSYPFHSLLFKLPNKEMGFPFSPLKLPNKGREEYSKMILFIHFHSISFPPPKRSLRVSIAISQAPTNKKWTFLLIWKSICHKIDGMLFWGFSHSWDFSYSDRHLYSRLVEALGLRRTDDLNKALISKFGWSVASNADKTWVHLPKFKYLQDWRNQQLPTRKEFTTHFHCLITRACLYHRIGSGSNTNILYMDWSMAPYNPQQLSPFVTLPTNPRN